MQAQELSTSLLQSDLLTYLTAVTKRYALSEMICEDLFRFYGLPIDFSESALQELRKRMKSTFADYNRRDQLVKYVRNDFYRAKAALAYLRYAVTLQLNFPATLLVYNSKTLLYTQIAALLGVYPVALTYSEFTAKHKDAYNALFVVKGKLVTYLLSGFASLSGIYYSFTVDLYGIRDLSDLQLRDVHDVHGIRVESAADTRTCQTFVCYQIYKYKNLVVVRDANKKRCAFVCGEIERVLKYVKMQFEECYLVTV